MKPASDWDEDYILALPRESDEFELKGALLLDLKNDANEDDVLNELAKQLSAFANTGGGQIVYGVEKDGTIGRGGVSVAIKNGTKEWLETKIPSLTEYEILGFSVREIPSRGSGSKIALGKALYIVDVPDSEKAPHQSTRDRKYYVRNGSHSEPARHKIIEDIRNRQKHPRILLGQVMAERVQHSQGEHPNQVKLEFFLPLVIVNEGSLKSTDTFLLMTPESGSCGTVYSKDVADQVAGTKKGSYQRHLRRPLAPHSEVIFWTRCEILAEFDTYAGRRRWCGPDRNTPFGDIAIECTIFADNAPPHTDRITMENLGLVGILTQLRN